MEEHSVPARIFVYILGISVPLIISYYLGRWLSNAGVRILKMQTVSAAKGLTSLSKDDSIQIDISRILYNDKEVPSLVLLRFVVSNDSRNTFPSGSKFFFVGQKGATISPASVIDMSFELQSEGELVKIVRADDSELGPGFELKSGLPPSAHIEIKIVLDPASDVASAESILLKRLHDKEGRTRIVDVTARDNTIHISAQKLIILIVGAASVYAFTWMLINIYAGNYSSGARIINAIWKVLFGAGFIPD